MIEALKEAVLDKAGIKMQGRGDCEMLSDLILGQTNEFVSYNTLRRMYGFAPEVKPRVKTLDVLAQFCGYASFQRFSLQHSRFERWHRQLDVVHRTEGNNPSQCIQHIFQVPGNLERVELATQIACTYIDAGRWVDFSEFCHEVLPFIKDQDYMAQLYFGNRIGLRLGNMDGQISKALLHPSVVSLVCTIHINYPNARGFCGRWWERINRTKQNAEIDCLIKCLLQTKRLLLGQPVKKGVGKQILANDTKHLHPILRSRVIATLWMEGRRDFRQLWRDVHGRQPRGLLELSWVHEVTMLALMTGDTTLARHVAELKFQSSNIPFYQLHHLHLNFLLRVLVKVSEQDLSAAHIALRSFDLSHIRIGYRGIAELIHLRLQTALCPENLRLQAVLESKIKETDLPYFHGSWKKDYLNHN